jgi:hypothetical protein
MRVVRILLGLFLAFMDVSVGYANPVPSQLSVWSFDSKLGGMSQGGGEELSARHVADALMEAMRRWNARDIEGFLKVYNCSPSLVMIEDGEEFVGYDKLASTYHQTYDLDPDLMGIVRVDHVKVEMLQPDLALIVGQYVVKNPRCNTYYSDNLVMRSIAGLWKVVFERASTARSDH